MYKILIVSHAMEIGGAEKALLGLLGAFDYSRCEVDLFLHRHSGELMDDIPQQVNLLPENKKYASIAVPLGEVISNRAWLVALGRYIGKRKSAQYVSRNKITKDSGYVYVDNSHKYTVRFLPEISNKEYDLAISFLTPHYIVQKKCRAKKKIAWIHTDYSSIDVDTSSEIKIWSAYDNIVSISDAVTETFLQRFPSLRDKIIKIENIHPSEYIKRRAEEFDASAEMSGDEIKLLSVGRFCTQKNFDNVPDICRRMENIKWYIIGFGTDEELIRKKIAEAGMQDRVIILGKKVNPYPYFKACDFYVQPSRYEGNAVTVNEALILGKKVVVTDYATARAQINDGVDGVIVPMDNAGCAEGLMKFIGDSELQNKISENLKKTDYSKAEGVEKIMRLLDG